MFRGTTPLAGGKHPSAAQDAVSGADRKTLREREALAAHPPCTTRRLS